MRTTIQVLIIFMLIALPAFGQHNNPEKSALTIRQIMQDPDWIGSSPDNVYWSADSRRLYFTWNPGGDPSESLYHIRPGADNTPVKVSPDKRKTLPPPSGEYNRQRTKRVYEEHGDLFLHTISTNEIFQITRTLSIERSPYFSHNQEAIIYQSENNLYAWNILKGQTIQLTNFVTGQETPESKPWSNEQEKWLYNEQMRLFTVLEKRKQERERIRDEREFYAPQQPKQVYTGKNRPGAMQLSPDEKYVTYLIYQNVPDMKRTEVPEYVTESGYTENIKARSKVGTPWYTSAEMYIYDILNDTIIKVQTENIPGITDPPDYRKDYPGNDPGKADIRKAMFSLPVWSDDGEKAVVTITSLDNKDRWIMLLDIRSGELKLLDRQRDEAWIGGPGTGWRSSGVGWMPDNKRIWYQSEETGYAHLYTVHSESGSKKALTEGKFETYNPVMSDNKKYWFFSSNAVHPGERHYYRMPVEGGKPQQITSMEGNNEVYLSPDEKWLAILYSASNRPWELYLMENRNGSVPVQITRSLTGEFKSYPWRKPEIVTFSAEDGAEVYARLYKPEILQPKGPAVIFVHGAGYLQNAHKWWSSYFREYMFHNFLADNGYVVLDIDYRGSAGYGRDWRTAIYRHMGGKDLSDQVDGAKFLVEQYQVDPERIGIYGGSYGGFITLMAMFTRPDVFAAGAALRAVTDWAHYNHGYTANILNTPVQDSLAYVKSSPIYYAEGLKGALLICHGMVDDNVHFQDVVRLAQRLIELGKDNWELAVYPVESHSFVEPSSWTDEYKRIFRLFEENLK